MARLIAYFSRKGNNYVNGEIKELPIGNTEIVASLLRDLTEAGQFQIEPVIPYSMDYSECIEEAKRDQHRDARPELKTWLDSLAEYDTIYLGYPNYWGTMPMAVFTFLEHYDFFGKTIKPFCTHEGSGMGTSEADIKRLCPNAHVAKGLAIRGADVKNAKSTIQIWI